MNDPRTAQNIVNELSAQHVAGTFNPWTAEAVPIPANHAMAAISVDDLGGVGAVMAARMSQTLIGYVPNDSPESNDWPEFEVSKMFDLSHEADPIAAASMLARSLAQDSVALALPTGLVLVNQSGHVEPLE